MVEYKCDQCFDTGCRCGGIGLTCHGCCDCEANKSFKTNEIDPCPLCGNYNIKESEIKDQGRFIATYYCLDCGCEAPQTSWINKRK